MICARIRRIYREEEMTARGRHQRQGCRLTKDRSYHRFCGLV